MLHRPNEGKDKIEEFLKKNKLQPSEVSDVYNYILTNNSNILNIINEYTGIRRSII